MHVRRPNESYPTTRFTVLSQDVHSVALWEHVLHSLEHCRQTLVPFSNTNSKNPAWHTQRPDCNVLKFLASHDEQLVAFMHETQLGLQVAHLSIPASKNPVMQEQLLLMFLLESAQVSQVDEIVQVAHRDGHLLQVPLV